MYTALQLYSIRDEITDNFLPMLKKLASMGYESVQFAGFYNTKAEDLKAVLIENNLRVAGSHTPIELLSEDKIYETITYNQSIGNDLLICPYLPEGYRDSLESYKKTAEMLNRIGEKCRREGMTFAYHNHDFEFTLYNGKTGFDIIFQQSDPANLKMELDCYWAIYAEHDPLKIIESYPDRIVSLHLKDMARDKGLVRSTELGKGFLSFEKLLKAAFQHNIKWGVIEQEHFNQSPLLSAKESLIGLQNMIEKYKEY